MKSMIVVALALVAVAAALPVEQQPIPVQIVKSNFDQQPNGAYSFEYENSDGTNRQEQGELKQVTNEDNETHEVVVVRGSFNYINPDGVQETITYVADESGYHAEGPSVPQPPARR